MEAVQQTTTVCGAGLIVTSMATQRLQVSTLENGQARMVSEYLPRRDRRGVGLNWTFGSAHDRGFYVANCEHVGEVS